MSEYGVQFQHLSGHIDAGRVGFEGGHGVFKDRSDVTGQAIWAVAEWLLHHDDGEPYYITNPRTGESIRLTAERVATPWEWEGGPSER